MDNKNNAQVLRKANRYLIYQCVVNHGPLTTEDIIHKTGVSRPTVVNQLKALIKEELISFNGFSESTGGRSPSLYIANPSSRYAIGVDFEFPAVRIAIANNGGEELCYVSKRYDIVDDEKYIIADICSLINNAIDTSGINRDKIIGVGIGLPGIIEYKNGKSVYIERINNWKNISICEELSSILELPVYLRNDVHLLGLAEKKLYLSPEVKDFIYIGLRGGVGSLIFRDGKPVEGAHGNAGFIGHTTMNPDGEKCICGSRGCLDIYAGELSMAKHYLEMKRDPIESIDIDDLTLQKFIKLAESGDEQALSLVKTAGRYLGIAVSNLVKTLEIRTIIIGAGFDLETSVFFKEMHQAVNEYLNDDIKSSLTLRSGKLSSKEYPLGGCFLTFDHMFSKPRLSLSI